MTADATRPAHLRGVLALAVAGILFGATFIVVQDAIGRAEVLPFLATRFTIGALVLTPIALRRSRSATELSHGVFAGLCLFVGYVLQTIGLNHTTAATSAFVTYLLVVLVPLIVAIRTRRPPPPAVVIGVALAVGGLQALSGASGSFGRGEILTLGAALCFAVHIIVLGEVSARHDAFRLTLWQLLTVAVACAIAGLITGTGMPGDYRFDGSVLWAAAFCGVGATAVAFWCMSWGQKVVPESQAAIVLLLEPVSAGIVGEVTGEHLGARGLLGAGLILAAVLVTEFGGRRQPNFVGTELAVPTPLEDDDAEPAVS